MRKHGRDHHNITPLLKAQNNTKITPFSFSPDAQTGQACLLKHEQKKKKCPSTNYKNDNNVLKITGQQLRR